MRSGGKQRGLTPFHDDKIRSHITHDMVTTFQFTYLHLLEAATDKKEVRLQFYLNSNGTWHSLENLLLHLLAFFKIIFFVSHFREQILFFSLQTWKMEFAQDKWSFFWPRKAKACVKSSVYFADRLMTSKRSRSLFFTAWKTSFRPPTTLQQKQKNLPYILSYNFKFHGHESQRKLSIYAKKNQ